MVIPIMHTMFERPASPIKIARGRVTLTTKNVPPPPPQIMTQMVRRRRTIALVGMVVIISLTSSTSSPDLTILYDSKEDRLGKMELASSTIERNNSHGGSGGGGGSGSGGDGAVSFVSLPRHSPESTINHNHNRLETNGQQEASRQPNPKLSVYPICRNLIPGDDAYVCRGPEYDRFADKFEQFVLWSHEEENDLRSHFKHIKSKLKYKRDLKPFQQDAPLWGRRQSPFPANSTLLAVGSSHTRQIFQTIECQYPTLTYEEVEPHADGQRARRGSYYRMEFANHAKVHLLTNNYLFYSVDWQKNLEHRIGVKLVDLDAIVIGKMIESQQVMNTSLMQNLIQQSGGELQEEDFLQRQGPGMLEFAKVYSGPIVAHSLMADWGLFHYTAQHWRNVLWHISVHYPQRATSIRVVEGFRYVELLGACHTDEWKEAAVCEEISWKHPCFGNRGGHGDLLAWDIIEALHDIWDNDFNTTATISTTIEK